MKCPLLDVLIRLVLRSASGSLISEEYRRRSAGRANSTDLPLARWIVERVSDERFDEEADRRRE